MTLLKFLLSPFGKILALILAILTAIGTVYINGRMTGVNNERTRSKKVVTKVQTKMDRQTQKSVTNKEVQDRLKDGTF